MPLATSVLNGALGVIGLIVALTTVIVGALSFSVNALDARKQTRLQRCLDAYKSAMSWQVLWERASEPPRITVGDLWSRLFDARESSEYHKALLYGDAKSLGKTYHDLTCLLREAYEDPVVKVLNGASSEERSLQHKIDSATRKSINKARLDYLGEVKRLTSVKAPLRRLRIRGPIDPPAWLVADAFGPISAAPRQPPA